MQTGDRAWCEKVAEGALVLGFDLKDQVLSALALHATSLLRWNQKVNLTAITDPMEVAEKHVLDSLAILPHLPASGPVLDMGSGGGFPGMVIAVMRPDLEVLMVDSVEKKMVFVRDVIRNLGLKNARALHLRVETLPGSDIAGKGFSCIVSRAFTALDRFVGLSLPLLAPSGSILAMKGPEGSEETDLTLDLFSDLDIKEHGYALPFGGGERRIVEITPLGRKAGT